MSTVTQDFAAHCCDLLSSVGPCAAKRMFGGYSVAVDGFTLAWLIDLGGGPTLWLKANEETRGLYEAAGCRRFTYTAKGVERSVNYYSAPEEAMESPQLMAPWARQALDCALKARAGRPRAKPRAKPATPAARRPRAAAAPRKAKPALARASRKSARG